jgi:diguanylate cyclase (GGDEF)-like protein
MVKRERLFREHRSLDGLTQLGDGGYMAAQIGIELRLQRAAALAMLRLEGFDGVVRAHGLAESDRLLQAASHLLLLNLRPDDLLCRYAADRFCVLMPGLQGAQAQARAEHLRQALSLLSHHTRAGTCLQLPARLAVADVDSRVEPDAQLLALARRLTEAP